MKFKVMSLVSLLSSVALLSSPAFSMKLNEGEDSEKNMPHPGKNLQKKDLFKIEMKIFEDVAEKTKNDIGMLYIAHMYFRQRNDRYTSTIHDWCEKAAETGNEKAKKWKNRTPFYKNLEALVNKNNTFIFSQEIYNHSQAVRTFLENVEKKGSGEAAYSLGKMYMYGTNVEKDLNKAIEYHTKAASKENTNAMNCLGDIYRFGGTPSIFPSEDTQSIDKDINKAIEWYTKAAHNGDNEAWSHLASLYLEDLKDPNKAVEYYRKAAEGGDDEAWRTLSVVYLVDLKDLNKAVECYKKYTENSYDRGTKNARIMCKIASRYLGLNNTEEAIKWYKKAAEDGSEDAQFKLGSIYLDLNNTEEAINWYKKAAEDGNEDAQFKLGSIYLDLNNTEEAIQWYKKAANNKNANAMYSLAEIYYKRSGDTEKKLKKAEQWAQQAIETKAENEQAQKLLEEIREELQKKQKKQEEIILKKQEEIRERIKKLKEKLRKEALEKEQNTNTK